MPVIRTAKTRDFTVVDNHYLKCKELSLRSKGLFTQLLSLPESWVYSIAGLACLSRDGADSIRSGIRELEQAGYITRTPRRDHDGRFCGYEYLIRESPGLPMPERPSTETPTTDVPAQAEQPQSNKNISNTQKSNTNLSNINLSNIQSNPTGTQTERSFYEY
jgi:hypothetical protein